MWIITSDVNMSVCVQYEFVEGRLKDHLKDTTGQTS